MTDRGEEVREKPPASPTDRPRPYRAAIALIVALALIGGCLVVSLDIANRVARNRRAHEALGQDPYIERSRVRSETVLVIGADENVVTGFMIVRANAGASTLSELTIPADGMLKPKHGPAVRLDELYRQSTEVAVARLSEYLQIPIANWIVIPPTTFKDALADNDVMSAFSTLTASNFPDRARFEAYRASLGDSSANGVVRIGFPVRSVDIDGALYVQPHREEIADAIGNAWGVPAEALAPEPNVVVHNGTDRTGFAAKVARGLVEYGFQVSSIGNAPTDQESATRIVVRPGFEEPAAAVARQLAVPSPAMTPLEDERAGYDIAVVVGHDYPEMTVGTDTDTQE